MIDSALLSKPGGRDNNEDFVLHTKHNTSECFILCDGLGGHACGEVASSSVARYIADKFEKEGDSPTFLDDAINGAQQMLLDLQQENNMQKDMKTTLVVLIMTDEHIKWAHIGDSRLYHIYENGNRYERTKDHSMVQILCDIGEITEDDMRHHEERNKILRVMGSEWSGKSFDKSAILEREKGHAFALMTDGFWEYVKEDEMLELLKSTSNSKEWLIEMEKLVVSRADMTKTDNYSAIGVRL